MYTEGEWRVYKNTLAQSEYAIDIKHKSGDKTYREIAVTWTEPNARLIAAAPMLYEALKELTNFLYGYSESESRVPDKWYPRFKEKYLRGYDALAKVEGKE